MSNHTPPVRKFPTRLVAIVAIPLILANTAYVSALTGLYFIQDGLIFFPSREVPDPPAALKWDFEDVVLRVGDDTTHGWFVHTAGPPRGTILFSHGNGGSISSRIDIVEEFRGMGFDVLLYDYGGYGKSSGTPSEVRCQKDIRAVWKFLVDERLIDPKSIVLMGRSMGGGPTCHLATEVKEGAVILESTFKSVPDMGARQFPIFPVWILNVFVRHRFDNIGKIARIESPLLILHSREDEVVPYTQGEGLFQTAREPKNFVAITGGHNGGFLTPGRTKAISDFLDGLFPVSTTPERQ